MKAVLFSILCAVLVFAGAADSATRRLAYRGPGHNNPNTVITALTVTRQADTVYCTFRTPRNIVNVQQFFLRCTPGATGVATNDSIKVEAANMRTLADTTYVANYMPILWITSGGVYATSETVDTSPAVLYESAIPVDSTFSPGAGDYIDIRFTTPGTDTVLVSEFGWENKE